MFDRQSLLTLSELDLAGMETDEAQFIDFSQKIDAFVDGFPDNEDETKRFLGEKDYSSLAKCLAAHQDMLTNIRANKLAGECRRQIGRIHEAGAGIDHAKTEEDLITLLSNISMLSIDIQMLRPQEGQAATGPWPEIGPVPGPPAMPAAIRTPRLGPPSILAVDDSAFFLNSLKMQLKNTPYKLICVNSGAAAMGYLERESPDLFLLDIEMPQMDGYELAQNIRQAGQAARIIFLTNNAYKNAVVKAVEAGASDFIVKPIDRTVLLARIKKNLE